MPRWISCQGVWCPGILVAAVALQRRAALVELLLGDQDVGGALVEVDAHAVAGLEDGQAAAGRRFRRGVEDRGRARGAGLAAVADAGERDDALLDEVVGGPHVHDLGAARIADRPGAAHEQQAGLVDLERGIVDALVVVLRPVEDDGAALEGVGVLRVRQVALAELLGDDAGLHDGAVEQVALEDEEAGLVLQRLVVRADHVRVDRGAVGAVLADGLAVDGQRVLVDLAGLASAR